MLFKTNHFDLLIKRDLLKKVKKTVSSQEANTFGIQLGGEPRLTVEFP